MYKFILFSFSLCIHFSALAADFLESPSQECLFWHETEDSGRLKSRVFVEENGKACLCCAFYYDEEGQLVKQTISGDISGNSVPLIIKEDGYPEDNGVETVSLEFSYFDKGDAPISQEENDLSLAEELPKSLTLEADILPILDEVTLEDSNDPMRLDTWDLFSLCRVWNWCIDSGFKYIQRAQTSAHKAKMSMHVELKLPDTWPLYLELFGKEFLGESTYLLMGHSHEETITDCYGENEICDKARITFINGILTTRKMMTENLVEMSRFHGGAKIHYVFRPSEGWTWDISRAITIKLAHWMGFRSIHAFLLAQLWREMIEEMGGVDGGGTIVHYSHSLGGAETDRARHLLTPEEQKMIRVFSFGSATFIKNIGFQSVVNHVSIDDGVSNNYLIDPIGHIRYYFDSDLDVRFHGDPLSFPVWPIDHFLIGPTYGPILEELGREFLAEFKPK